MAYQTRFIHRIDDLIDLEELMDDLTDDVRLVTHLVLTYINCAAPELFDLEELAEELQRLIGPGPLDTGLLADKLVKVFALGSEHELLRPDTKSDPCHFTRLVFDAVQKLHTLEAAEKRYNTLQCKASTG